MSTYLTIRKWVDRDLSRGTRFGFDASGKMITQNDGRPGLTYFLLAVPTLLDSLLEGFPKDGLSDSGIASSLVATLPIAGFIFWRQIRLLKAKSIKSGRYYERKTRAALPSEYQDSEDAFLAARRRTSGTTTTGTN